MFDYPPEQDGQRDAPGVKVENDKLPLLDQKMWDIEWVEHLRTVTEPYVGDHGQEISVTVITPHHVMMKRYGNLRAMRNKSAPKAKKSIKRGLSAFLESFATLNPLYSWEGRQNNE